MLIGVAGLSGSGKNYCTKILQRWLYDKDLSCHTFAFGDNLKQICADETSTNVALWYEESLKDIDMEILAPVWCKDKDFAKWANSNTQEGSKQAVSMRWWMQNYSDYLKIRWNKPNAFIDLLGYEIADSRRENKVMCEIITDVRYLTEVEFVHKLGGQVVYIFNPSLQIKDKHTHNSEQLQAKDCDYVLMNDKGKTSDGAIWQQWTDILKSVAQRG